MNYDRLVRISKANERQLPFKASTFYKWHHTKKFEKLFLTFGRTVFIDLEELERLFDPNKGEGGEKRKDNSKKRN